MTLAPQIVVGLDAATPVVSAAVASTDGRLLGFVRREGPLPASQRLLADLDHLLAGAEPAASVRAVAVTLGPGMFTGLRVGLAIAKTLARGWGVPLYGYSTLETAAARWPGGCRSECELQLVSDPVCVLLDARRGELYSGIYRPRGESRPEVVRPDRVETLSALLEALEALPFETVWFSGNGAALHEPEIAARLGVRARRVPAPWNGPGADAAALAAAREWSAGAPGLDPLAAAPLYLRASDAERRHP